MTTEAVVMMIIAMVTVWGGLVAGIVNLAKHPDQDDEATAPAASPQQ
ncbi:methionine/alanine import family NSS transporter small subunit [Leucobacter insecticola]|uniref:Methionine/alanine import family NSS transporter small subunit n=1 Tax=Leucobacter insecticola TaxID=2714934 RepID=A0A6G8FIY7_9MICO|nr:methionine/alanine import family NSS transporter small subunit [Leucobacter insecticola]